MRPLPIIKITLMTVFNCNSYSTLKFNKILFCSANSIILVQNANSERTTSSINCKLYGGPSRNGFTTFLMITKFFLFQFLGTADLQTTHLEPTATRSITNGHSQAGNKYFGVKLCKILCLKNLAAYFLLHWTVYVK